ncbi:DUF6232 family protein [Bacillus sp. 165]|uniref:DUF6232 family protein n=1 Tax=Bacillus sp. 165 TaxID=1529117 RepID=UPI001ADBD16C|nr:DUF6232 family protein [Bacillus sp. 165]MBO9130038.1 hypothetical protein [Bacillus sp. 165]
MEQVVNDQYFYEGDLNITRTRVYASGQVYAMANITSARKKETKPDLSWEKNLAIIGGVTLLLGILFSNAILAGLCVVFWGAAMIKFRFNSSTYSIFIKTAAGEIEIYHTKDKHEAEEVLQAFHKAFLARG